MPPEYHYLGSSGPITDVVIGGSSDRRLPVPVLVDVIANQLKLRAERWMARYPAPPPKPPKPRTSVAGVMAMVAFATGGANRSRR